MTGYNGQINKLDCSFLSFLINLAKVLETSLFIRNFLMWNNNSNLWHSRLYLKLSKHFNINPREEQSRLRMDVDNDISFIAFNSVVWLITQIKVKTRTFSY